MNQSLAYKTLRTLSGMHTCVKRTHHYKMLLRYDDLSIITAEAIREAARTSLRQSDLSRALDLKTKCGRGAIRESSHERELLKGIAESDDATLDDAMRNLLSFYAQLSK